MRIVEQVNITVPNAPSSLAKVGDKLRAAEVNIDAITCTEGPTHTVIHMIVSDAETAKLVLKDLGTVTAREVLELQLKNKPGAIAQVGRACAAMGINIRNIYATTCGREAMVYVSVEDVGTAMELLKKWEKSAGKIDQ